MKTLGPISATFLAKLYDENKVIFEIPDVQRILDKNYNKATDFLRELIKRKIIARLKSGKFLIIPQEAGNAENYIGNWYVAAREVVNSPDYYIGFYSAMHYWGMLTQPLVKIFAATPQRQIVPREMKGRLKFVIINKDSIWGITEEWVTNTEKVRISDLEKTILDALRHPQYCGGITEIAKSIWLAKDKISYKQLADYIVKYDKNVIAKRLGYILEILKIGSSELVGRLKSYIKDAYDPFDPTLPEQRIDRNDWRLIDNVGQKQIINIIEH
jgi:predicted transcriptional regulator of viral defense system